MKTFLFAKLALISSILISPAYSSNFQKNASVSFYDKTSKQSDDGQVLISTPYFLQGQNKYEPGEHYLKRNIILERIKICGVSC